MADDNSNEKTDGCFLSPLIEVTNGGECLKKEEIRSLLSGNDTLSGELSRYNTILRVEHKSYMDLNDTVSLYRCSRMPKRNAKKIVEIVANRPYCNGVKLAERYFTIYSENIEDCLKDLQAETSLFLRSLLVEPIARICLWLHHSIHGGKKTRKCLTELMVSIRQDEIESIKLKYMEIYKKSLVDDVKSSLCGTYKRALLCLLTLSRLRDVTVDEDVVAADAIIFSNNHKLKKDNYEYLMMFMVKAQNRHIKRVAEYIKEGTKKVLADIVAKYSPKPVNHLYFSIVQYAVDPLGFYAYNINRAMTERDVPDIIRVLVSKTPTEMYDILECYQRVYEKIFIEEIESFFPDKLVSGIKLYIRNMT